MSAWIEGVWYGKSRWRFLLWPLSWLYLLVVAIRKTIFTMAKPPASAAGVTSMRPPIIVVGNLTVGGAGKTPLVVALVEYFQRRGLRPGVVSRGYGGVSESYPVLVERNPDPRITGDEPALIHMRTRCPVVVAPKRAEALQKLLDVYDCDVVISDDGLQHLALPRDMEIVVVDAQRGWGNGLCLPAGPLREPVRRVQSVDLVVSNGLHAQVNADYAMQLRPVRWKKVSGEEEKSTNYFAGRTAHAVAAIGNPGRFFATLADLDVASIQHAFPDHYSYAQKDIEFNDDLPVLMTEKDAVKCKSFNLENAWYLEVGAELNSTFYERIDVRLNELRSHKKDG
ncbi:tetraacyldisaccharide 4'-kinase [Hahella sp. HN01]|uniref:tetraacyldisaccharide 4'-kinase n=1 Tax=Hahella sp. HN01 TaxID=2847262 RepID=UPI001C1F1971|nr:tetraacyldisaccharide 4'-kinase [Hahella sp. HN01]MBU6950578.1 tetraacyldisaccharide 4'-kinase [Hahella sp. HN01]